MIVYDPILVSLGVMGANDKNGENLELSERFDEI